MNINRTRFSALLGGFLGLSLCISTALADGSAALKQSPRGANAVMTIDVAKLMASPLGKSSELQSKLMTGYADRPLAVPATAKNVTLVAGVHPMGLEAVWTVAIVESSTEPRLDRMVTAQGGFLDSIEGKPAAWTKHDIYYVQMDKQTMGVVRPAQRQFVSRWIGGKNEAPLSTYLSNAVTAGKDAEAVFALDLDGVFAPTGVRYAMRLGDLPSLEKIDPAQQSKLMTALASAKGMTITMRATDKINAEWVIEFGQDVSALGAQVEPFIVDVLRAANLSSDNADKWEFKAQGNRIVGKGTMELEGLTRLVSLLAPGDMSVGSEAKGADAAAAGGGNTANADPKNAAAAASQKYFKAITKTIDNLGPKISPTQGGAWLSAQARMIESLPILNVDPALQAWGAQVAETYRRAGQELVLGQANAKNVALGIATPTSSTTSDNNGEGTGDDTAESRAAFRNASDQRRQAAQAERGAAAQRAIGYFNQIAPMRAQLRQEMTQKYGVEF